MTTITDAQKSQFLAEIRFLRSLAYMDLTDAWGPVILATENDIANPSYTSQPKPTPVDQIDTFLISNLQFAINTLPVSYANNPVYPSNDVGRATKGAALTLLAKLYLRKHEWQKVVDLTQQVMDLEIYESLSFLSGIVCRS